jgi:GNAT superfamily N-acetyltransferase
MGMPETVIWAVSGGPDLDAVRDLFAEYGSDVSRAYCLAGFDAEMAGLPGAYGPPQGALFLACVNGVPAGTVGLRPLGGGAAEMKRLYVRPRYQGQGLGRRLAQAVIDRARGLGYGRLCLDTLEHMTEARALYRDMGFNEIPPYHADTAPGMSFMERVL